VADTVDATNKIVTITLSGGTEGTVYTIKNTITTDNGRVAVKRFRVKVEKDFL